jgi:hypothetical protein
MSAVLPRQAGAEENLRRLLTKLEETPGRIGFNSTTWLLYNSYLVTLHK